MEENEACQDIKTLDSVLVTSDMDSEMVGEVLSSTTGITYVHIY